MSVAGWLQNVSRGAAAGLVKLLPPHTHTHMQMRTRTRIRTESPTCTPEYVQDKHARKHSTATICVVCVYHCHEVSYTDTPVRRQASEHYRSCCLRV